MANYKVTFKAPAGKQIQTAQGLVSEITIDAADDVYILDSAEYSDVDLPFEMGCRLGGCTVCSAKLMAGTIQHESPEDLIIDENLRNQGYVLTCAAFPRSDCTLMVFQDDELFGNLYS